MNGSSGPAQCWHPNKNGQRVWGWNWKACPKQKAFTGKVMHLETLNKIFYKENNACYNIILCCNKTYYCYCSVMLRLPLFVISITIRQVPTRQWGYCHARSVHAAWHWVHTLCTLHAHSVQIPCTLRALSVHAPCMLRAGSMHAPSTEFGWTGVIWCKIWSSMAGCPLNKLWKVLVILNKTATDPNSIHKDNIILSLVDLSAY